MNQTLFLLKQIFLINILIVLIQCKPNHGINQVYQNHHENKNQSDLWYEINESIILNCSLRVNKDQHVVWHRKYDKFKMHVLTIGSETFISDLRIRPIKQQFNMNKNRDMPITSNEIINSPSYGSDDIKYTWNLEIRRLRKEDTAMYYCFINSENLYGHNYKLHVLPHLKMLNSSDIAIDTNDDKREKKQIKLICKYDDIIVNDHIRWFINRFRIRNNQFNDVADGHTLTQTNQYSIFQDIIPNTNTTISTLIIHNINVKPNFGKYKCQYKGLVKTVRIHPSQRNDTSSRILHRQTIFSMSSSSSSSSSSLFLKSSCKSFSYYLSTTTSLSYLVSTCRIIHRNRHQSIWINLFIFFLFLFGLFIFF